MNTITSGAPADGGEPIVDVQEEQVAQAPEAEQEQAPRQLTPEEYEQRDRQKTAALREARARANNFRNELDTIRQEIASLRQTGQFAAANKLSDQLEDLPDPEQNPMEALKALHRMATNLNGQQRQTTEQEQRAQEEARNINQLKKYVQDAEETFREEHPDYDDACKHLRKALMEEYEDQGFRGEQLQLALNRELVRLAVTAGRNGADPAEVYWRVAIRRGYQAKSGARQIEQMKRLQESDVRVPRGGGKNTNFSREALLEAKGDDFEKAWKIYEQQWGKR